jgi:hypothetical protein
MVMAGEHIYQSFCLNKGFHRGIIAMVVAIDSVTVVLVSDHLGIEARLSFLTALS